LQIEIGAQMYLTDPSQSYYAVFNNPADPNFVGYIFEITGFDSPETRENASNINAGDGGHHGPFWHGRRPFTLSGMIVPTTPVAVRSAKMTKIDNVLNRCLRQDGYLAYTPSDGISRYLLIRKQQPHRITAGQSAVQKNFQIAGVCRDYRFYASGSGSSASATGTDPDFFATNNGDAPSPAKWIITGPSDQPIISNGSQKIHFTNLPTGYISAGVIFVVDFTGEYPLAYNYTTGDSFYGYIDPILTDWTIAVPPGVTSEWSLTGSNQTGATTLEMQWNDAWW
jgi:hypothetical protein